MLVADAAQMYEDLDPAAVLEALKGMCEAAKKQGYKGVAILKWRRLWGWLSRTEIAHNSATKVLSWEDIYLRVATGL
eukprot:9577179-Alexandrium_andersonii.AAC.1